jgi:hypothetical protein
MSKPVLFMVALALSCAPFRKTPTNVYEMSAARHETEAAKEDQAAREEASKYVPETVSNGEGCMTRQGAPVPCWSLLPNPTAWHLQEAERHRSHAEAHRLASQELHANENKACAGIVEADRDMSPLDHCADIERVEKLHENGAVRGVVVFFHEVPGLSVTWLQHLIDCHLARMAEMGFESDERPACPLALRGVRATAWRSWGGIALRIEAPDAKTAAALVERAQAFFPCPAELQDEIGDAPADEALKRASAE